MTKEEIIEKIEDNPMFPYIQPDSLKEIVEFVIENCISREDIELIDHAILDVDAEEYDKDIEYTDEEYYEEVFKHYKVLKKKVGEVVEEIVKEKDTKTEIPKFEAATELDSEMDKYFDNMELQEREMIYEDTFHKICSYFYNLGKQAGAKQLAEQGVSYEDEVDKDEFLGYCLEFPSDMVELADHFKKGDKVIVQIRKKE